MKKFVILLCVLLFVALTKSQMVYSQVPTTCFEIQSILVDACGNPEGENEMVRFIIGPNPLNTNTLNVTWPNNSFIGICQNTQTAANVLALNNTITSCGFIKEPIAGVLPAGSTVILVTSEDMDVTANSFAGLTDTLYMIFQCTSNVSGHFRNYSNTLALRTLTISFGGGCNDVVTYDANFLINQSGNPGAEDGATVNFTFAGNGTYTNPGCQAPINQLTVSTTASNDTICNNENVNLSAAIQGTNFISYFWSGGAGIFSSTTTLSTVYTANATIGGNENLYFNLVTTCGDTIIDTTSIFVNANGAAPNVVITPSGPTTFCQGGQVTLTASGADTYLWSTSSTATSIIVFVGGTYTITGTTTCGVNTTSVNVTIETPPTTTITPNGPTTFCQGSTVTLTASGVNSYLWSTGSTANSIVVTNSGTYSLTGTNSCGSVSATEIISVNNLPTAVITNSSPLTFCQGDSVLLTASGGSNYLWSTGSTSSSIYASIAGVYTLTSSNLCGSANTSATVSVLQLPIAATNIDSALLCPGDNANLVASGGNTYLWSNGSTNSSISVTTAGIYSVTVTNSCGNDIASVVVDASSLTVGFIADNYNGFAPLTVNFTNNSTNFSTYAWNFGDNTTSADLNPTHIFTEDGVFNTVLTVNDTNGCVLTTNADIVVRSDISYFIPNVFTPNSDSINDYFNIVGNGITSIIGRIFNRWGQEVYNWDSLQKGWDGNSHGTESPSAVYFYLINLNVSNGTERVEKGTVTLFR